MFERTSISFADNEQVDHIIPQVMLILYRLDVGETSGSHGTLKEGIGLSSYGQEDPMRIYQREGLQLFGRHYQKLRRNIAC